VDLDRLAARLDELESERAVHRLLVDYGTALDTGDEELLVRCFAGGGRWRLHRDGAVVREYADPDAFRAWVRRHHEEPHPPHQHVFTNPSISLDGDAGRVSSYFLRVDARPVASGETPFVFAMGRYEDEVARDARGHWHFRLRTAYMGWGYAPPV
jgi:hypothetical protein